MISSHQRAHTLQQSINTINFYIFLSQFGQFTFCHHQLNPRCVIRIFPPRQSLKKNQGLMMIALNLNFFVCKIVQVLNVFLMTWPKLVCIYVYTILSAWLALYGAGSRLIQIPTFPIGLSMTNISHFRLLEIHTMGSFIHSRESQPCYCKV